MANPKGNASSLKPYAPKWQSGPTQTIRVPIALADKALSYVRHLDAGEKDSKLNSDNQSLSHVIEKLEAVLDTPRNNFSRAKKSLLQSAINELKSLVTVL